MATNNSTAKAKYSFTKALRFPKPVSPEGKFYDLPSMVSERYTTFGYGKRTEFIRKIEKSPDPGQYDISINTANLKNAYSFGVIKSGVLKKTQFTPGPGTYNTPPRMGKEGRLISMLGKGKPHRIISKSPGPGAYDLKFEKNKGDYVLSTCKSQNAHRFAPVSSARFLKKMIVETPASGYYNFDKGFLKFSEVLSTVKSSGSRVFPISSRDFQFYERNESPGPGQYNLPSDFDVSS